MVATFIFHLFWMKNRIQKSRQGYYSVDFEVVLCNNSLIFRIRLKGDENMLKETNQESITTTLNNCYGVSDIISTLLDRKVEVKETPFTVLAQRGIQDNLKRCEIQMRLMGVPQEHPEEGYTSIVYRYIIFDSITSEVLVNSLKLQNHNEYDISDSDETYLLENGYDIKMLLLPIFNALSVLSKRPVTLDRDILTTTL